MHSTSCSPCDSDSALPKEKQQAGIGISTVGVDDPRADRSQDHRLSLANGVASAGLCPDSFFERLCLRPLCRFPSSTKHPALFWCVCPGGSSLALSLSRLCSLAIILATVLRQGCQTGRTSWEEQGGWCCEPSRNAWKLL